MIKKLSCFCVVLAIILSLPSCQREPQSETITPKTRTFYEYFDTVGTFYDYTGSDDAEFSALADMVEDMLSEYHKLYDIYHPYPDVVNIRTINDNAGGEPLVVDEKIIDLLTYSKEVYTITKGNTNIAMGAVLSIWHEHRTNLKTLPSKESLAKAGEHTDMNNLVIDTKNSTVQLLDPKMSLDVGAIAKGFAVEEIAKELEKLGKSGYVLDVGGNLRAIGTKENGDGWKTGVKNPDKTSTERYIYKLTLKNAAIATTGTYERYFVVGGKEYHHVIDKDTLIPTDRYLSVSVRSPSSALSDALSTGFFGMERDEIEEIVNKNKNLFVIVVTNDGELLTFGNE